MFYEELPVEGPARREPPVHHAPWYAWFTLIIMALILIGAVVGGGWWYAAQHGLFGSKETPVELRAVTPRGDLMPFEQSLIDIHKKAGPSVVHITSIGYKRDIVSRNVYQVPEGTGTGIVWDKKGHIITNYHVIKGANAAQVTLTDGSSYNASLTGASPANDVAVLKIDAESDKLVPIAIGSSSDLQVGQLVLAIGNPFGLDNTLTMGIISALHREIESQTHEDIHDVIQTDAPINPGNSGGPLLDSAGRLIGMNTAIYSPSGASAGIGFAIPVDTINKAVVKIVNDAARKAR